MLFLKNSPTNVRNSSCQCQRRQVKIRLVTFEGHRFFRFEQPERSPRVVINESLVLDRSHLPRPDDGSSVDIRGIINPFVMWTGPGIANKDHMLPRLPLQ